MKAEYREINDAARAFSFEGAALPDTVSDGETLTFSARGAAALRLFSFTVCSKKGTSLCRVEIENGERKTGAAYPVPVQATEIILPVFPCTEERVSLTLTFAAAEGIALSRVKTAEPLETGTDTTHLCRVLAGTGSFFAGEETVVRLPDPCAAPAVGSSIDLAVTDEFLYSIGGGCFTVAELSDPSHPRRIASLSGLGETRQIALSEDGKTAFVTARQCGVYVIDVSDPHTPAILSRYNSVELATGITVSGHYAFIANRQYGVEAVDVSDPAHPRHVALIRCGEAQSCKTYGGYIYLGLWGERRVDIYDIRDLGAAAPVAKIPLDGKGDDMAVCPTADGKRLLLFAATGQHPLGVEEQKPVYDDPRYGEGNGMEIFDVTDAAHPVRLSGVKTDGRYYFPSNDFWGVSVSRGADGNTYAFLLNTYNGVFVYDVSEPTEPKRVMHLYLPIGKGSPNFRTHKTVWAQTRAILLPFDDENEIYSPVGEVALRNGVLYLSGVYHDVFAYPCPHLCVSLPETCGAAVAKGAYYRLPEDGYGWRSLRHFAPEGQAFFTVPYGDRLIHACGSGGILVTDKDFTPIFRHRTEYPVQHFQLIGDRLYASETHGGLAVYRVETDGLRELRRYRLPSVTVVRMALIGGDEKWALLQADSSSVVTLSLTTGEVAEVRRTKGIMYYRNLSVGLAGGRYATAQGNGGEEYVYDFADGKPRVIAAIPKARTEMRTNEVPFAGKMLSIGKKGFVLYDPADVAGKTEMPPDAVPFAGRYFGKATVSGNLLMLAERISGLVSFLDISEIAAPRALASFTVAGNPDLMSADERYVYLPAGYQGVFRIDRAEIEGRSTGN